MRIFINRRPVEGPWGGGNLFLKSFVTEFQKAGHEVTFDLNKKMDAIFIQDPRYGNTPASINEIEALKKSYPEIKVFHRVNECDARKNTTEMDKVLQRCSKISDHTFFVSNWMQDYHLKRGWHCGSYSVVYNGVDSDHFYKREKINNKKTNIVTHHWSSNEMKGMDYYRFLDKFVCENPDFTFTYIGNCSSELPNSKVIDPLSGKELGDELGRYDVYVSGTRWDPGPNHIIESIASGIPTFVYALGGGAVEFAGVDNTFVDEKSLIEKLKSDYTKTTHAYKPLPWKQCISNVLETVEQHFK